MSEVKFKVGDKVRRKNDSVKSKYWLWGSDVSEVIDVTTEARIGPRGCDIRLLNRVGGNAQDWDDWWDSKYFELVPEASRPQVGEYWRSREGKIYGPLLIDKRTEVLHAGKFRDHEFWYPTGVFLALSNSDKDLVEKVQVCPHCHRPIDENHKGESDGKTA